MAKSARKIFGGAAPRGALLGAAALGCVSIAGAPPSGPIESPAPLAALPPPAGTPRTDRVVVLVVDGLRWQEVFLGVDPLLAGIAGLGLEEIVGPNELAPNLHALAQRGVALGGPGGAPVLASGPNFVSLPGYTEILSGRAPGCHENDCPSAGVPTLVDDFRAAPGATDASVAVITSWERIVDAAARDPSRATVSTGRTGGGNLANLERDEVGADLLLAGARSLPEPGHGDYRPDRATAEIALHHLRRTRPELLFVSLGDTDEFAHHGDYRGYLAALRQADATLGRMIAEVVGWGEEGRHVTFVVTADHGRCATFADHGRHCPESARTFLIAGGGKVPRRGEVDLEAPIYLRDIAPTVRGLANVAPSSVAPPGLAPSADGTKPSEEEERARGAPIAALLSSARAEPVAAR